MSYIKLNNRRIFLFFIFIIIAVIDVGTKNIKLTPCAVCCEIFSINVNYISSISFSCYYNIYGNVYIWKQCN